jgi:death-on-curing protein
MGICYLDIAESYFIHDKMIEIGGGRKGIRDFTLFHSAVERPKATFGGKDLYGTIWLKAAALIQSIIKNHPFNDGNKRTGYFTALRFLNINNYEIRATKKEIINFTLSIDTKNLPLKKIAFWFQLHSKKNR